MSAPLPQIAPLQIPVLGENRVLEYQQAARFDKFQNTLYQDFGGNLAKALPALMAIDPQRATVMQQQAQAALSAAMDLDTKKLAFGARLAGNITSQEQLEDARPIAQKFGIPLPDRFTPEWRQSVLDGALSGADRIKAEHDREQLAFEQLKETHAEAQRAFERDKPIVVAPDATLATRTPEGGFEAAYTAPPKIKTFEQAYYEALTKGDATGAATALQGIQTEANAKRDPNAQALARELSALRVSEAQARLDKMKSEAEPLDIQPDIQTTMAGRQYVDVSGYTGTQRNKAIAAAKDAGVVHVGKEAADALSNIDTARLNQRAILDNITDILPKDSAGRVAASVTVPLQKLLQTDEQVAAFQTWRSAAIQSLRAMAGSKGLRINRSEIEQAVANDIPTLTDTLGTARTKLAHVETMLENAEKGLLVRDRSVPVPAAAPKPAMPSAVPPKLKQMGFPE